MTGDTRPAARHRARAWQVRAYEPGDEVAIVALFTRVFGAGVAARDLGWWRWEFAACPAGSRIVLAVDADTGEVIAQYAALELPCHVDGRIEIVTQPVDSMVDPRWRGTGAFVAAAKRYFELFGHAGRCVASYGFPSPRAARLGQHQLGYVPAFMPVMALHANLFAKGRWQSLARSSPPLPVREVRRFGAEVDELWQRSRASHPFALVRDARYLNWRFAAAPTPHRMFLVDGARGVRAAFVVREGWCAESILALAEFVAMAGDAEALATALGFALCHAQARGFGRVETWFPPTSWPFVAARRLGFEAERSHSCMVARFYRSDRPVQWYLDRWFYTIGDSDAF